MLKRIASFICIMNFLIGAAFAQSADSVKTEIYSKLECCSCGISFDKCVCAEAKEMKAYIDALLENNVSKDDIFYKVAKKFSLNTIIDKETKAQVEKRLILEAGEKRPQLILESTLLDLGQVRKEQGEVKKIIRLFNKGSEKLILKNIRVSCDCVTVSLIQGKEKSPEFGVQGFSNGWKAVIEPNKSADLEVKLDLRHQSVVAGKLIRIIYISSNDPINPEAIVTVQAEVKG